MFRIEKRKSGISSNNSLDLPEVIRLIGGDSKESIIDESAMN